VLALTNVEDSSLARLADVQLYTRAGPEIGVASTKAYTTQLAAAYAFAVALAGELGTISHRDRRDHYRRMLEIPSLATRVLKNAQPAQALGQRIAGARSALFLGRAWHVATAMEGALKLKELAYIHAEGYAAGEMKHGPIALVDPEFFVLFVAPFDRAYEKIASTAQEVRAREGRILSIVTEGDQVMRELSEAVCEIPSCSEEVAAILATIPLQLLAYEAATSKGHDVDRPRNLAKSVTVE
jgi:glutamine---fructose-6-phosphate transaminase (isomerizing)